jgi:ribosomal protein S18 acetylase RimI-like enzyme
MDDPGGQCFGLAPITLAEKGAFDRVFASLAQPLSDYTFACTFIWNASLKLYWQRLDRHLCVFANGTGDLTMLMPPLPEAGATEADLRVCLDDAFDIMDRYNDRVAHRSRSRIEYVSDEMLERLSACGARGLNLGAAPMSGDYIYAMERMIDLAGGSLKSKRHARSKFMRDFPAHRTEPLGDQHVPACLELLDLWRTHGDTSHEGEQNDQHLGTDILRHRDTLSSQLALATWKELGLRGLVLLVGDQLVGFTLGEALSSQQASILIEKTHPDYPGAAQFIFSEFCRQAWSEYPECNVGDDWGIPSLRFTKQSYRPMKLLSKYMLTKQSPVVVAGAPILDLPMEAPRHETPEPPEPAPVPAAPAPPPEALAVSQPAPAPAPGSPPPHHHHANITLRRATLADIPAILDLEATCFTTLEETFNRRQVRYLISDPRATTTVAAWDGQIVGWSVGLVREHRRSKSGRLYAVAVHPRAQGQRLGRRLVQHTLDALARLGIERIYLEVRSDNHAAIRLYHKLGFATQRELPNYYGQGRHGVSMRRAAPALPPEAAETLVPAAEAPAHV